MSPLATKHGRIFRLPVVRDPALLATIVVLAGLLGLFVLYPLAAILSKAVIEDGRLTIAPLFEVLRQPNHRAAFANSLLLAGLVGIIGTIVGFVFALTATRCNLGDRKSVV